MAGLVSRVGATVPACAIPRDTNLERLFMKHQFKVLADAAVLALSGAANAAIDNGSTGNGELFFVAYESSTLLTYTADLGKLMSAFTPSATSQSFALSG